ncbi:MAG: molecular chaperone [Candidatus Methylomirabilales bacterium]
MRTTHMDRTGRRKPKDTHGQEALGLADLARFRQAAYRLFSTMFLYPDEERLRTVATVAGELGNQTDFLATFSFFIQWRDLLVRLRGLAGVQPASIEEQYVYVFIANPDYAPCLPYESAHVGSAAAPGWTAVELEREYAAAGLSISSSLKEAPDYAAVELEFMAFLCYQEACAWEGSRLTDGIEALKRQANFLERHLGRWFPAFARRVAAKDNGEVYAPLARAAEVFISHDRGLVEALVDGFESRVDTHPRDSV